MSVFFLSRFLPVVSLQCFFAFVPPFAYIYIYIYISIYIYIYATLLLPLPCASSSASLTFPWPSLEGKGNVDLSLVPHRRGLARGFIQNTTPRAKSFVDMYYKEWCGESAWIYIYIYIYIRRLGLYKIVPNLSSYYILAGKSPIKI